MQKPDQWKAMINRWTKQRSGCAVEWENDDPESLFVELAQQYADATGNALYVDCLDDDCGEPECINGASLATIDGEYDLICVCGEAASFEDFARVLSAGGVLIGVTSGELHYIETQEIFGRGINWPPARPVRFAIPDAVTAAGLELVFFVEYFGVNYCPDIDSFVRFLISSEIVSDFDAAKDAVFVREIQRKLASERGIRNTEHLAVYAVTKPA